MFFNGFCPCKNYCEESSHWRIPYGVYVMHLHVVEHFYTDDHQCQCQQVFTASMTPSCYMTLKNGVGGGIAKSNYLTKKNTAPTVQDVCINAPVCVCNGGTLALIIP